jgi:hypothetical protein
LHLPPVGDQNDGPCLHKRWLRSNLFADSRRSLYHRWCHFSPMTRSRVRSENFVRWIKQERNGKLVLIASRKKRSNSTQSRCASCNDCGQPARTGHNEALMIYRRLAARPEASVNPPSPTAECASLRRQDMYPPSPLMGAPGPRSGRYFVARQARYPVRTVTVACVEMCALSALSPGADHISAKTGRSFGCSS